MSPIWAYEQVIPFKKYHVIVVLTSARYWNGHYPPLLRGAVNAASNIGNIIGQLSFGFLGDAFGRKFVYGKELIICIIGTILVISLPNSIPTPTLKMIWIFCFRLLMGIGIGGDYPMSASIVSERSHLHTRGRLLAWIFSNQGWVILLLIWSRNEKVNKDTGNSYRICCNHNYPQLLQEIHQRRGSLQRARCSLENPNGYCFSPSIRHAHPPSPHARREKVRRITSTEYPGLTSIKRAPRAGEHRP
jgi:hypothetical protein